jgi:hypothetical protein
MSEFETPERRAELKAQRQAHAKKYLIPLKKGEGGRPVGSRNRLQAGFMYALSEDFAKYGKGAIEHARRIDPMGYIKTIANLMPKQFEQTTPLEELSDAELLAAISLIRSKLSLTAGKENAGKSLEKKGASAKSISALSVIDVAAD